jgi:hypothetical protein
MLPGNAEQDLIADRDFHGGRCPFQVDLQGGGGKLRFLISHRILFILKKLLEKRVQGVTH